MIEVLLIDYQDSTTVDWISGNTYIARLTVQLKETFWCESTDIPAVFHSLQITLMSFDVLHPCSDRDPLTLPALGFGVQMIEYQEGV